MGKRIGGILLLIALGGKGGDDIYSFTLPPIIFKLSGTLTDVETKEPLGDDIKVKLMGTDGSIGEVVTDPTGAYDFRESVRMTSGIFWKTLPIPWR